MLYSATKPAWNPNFEECEASRFAVLRFPPPVTPKRKEPAYGKRDPPEERYRKEP